jgi:hypothetical protein
MAKRLQVIVKDSASREIKRAARARRISIAEWVRQAIDQALCQEPVGAAGKELDIIRAAARGDCPTADIDRTLGQIERGYESGAQP